MLRAAALAVLLASCTPPGLLLPESAILRDVHLRGPATVPAVALTFDDGPNGRCTEAVLDALAEMHAPAAFFLVGRNVARGDDDALLARMVREGHTIGIHSWSHSVSPAFVPPLARREVRRAVAAVRDALVRAGVDPPPPVRLYRPAYGLLTGPVARAAADAGLEIVEWTVSVGDWRSGQSAEDSAAAILARVRPGDVVVLHDGLRTHHRARTRCADRGSAAAVVRLLVPALRTRGLEPVALPVLLGLAPPR
jgi:peptidoglycan/xylan/chitin deacetylase (PgdA/CDA1 family)